MNFDSLCFLAYGLFHLSHQMYVHRIVHSITFKCVSSTVMYPLSFVILMIFVFFYSLWVLVEIYLFYRFFKDPAFCFNNFSLFSCFKCYWFLVFMISFLLLPLGLFGWELSLSVWDLSLLSCKNLGALNFLLSTALAVSHKFSYYVFSFIFLETSSWSLDSLEVCRLVSKYFETFLLCFIDCYLDTLPFGEHIMILPLLNLLRFLWLEYGLYWLMFYG